MNEEITLRDHFAGLVIAGFAAGSELEGVKGKIHNRTGSPEAFSREAYRWADAMVKARENNG